MHLGIEHYVLIFFLLSITIGIILINTEEGNNKVQKNYRLKITNDADYCSLQYSFTYGLTWKMLPIDVRITYEPTSKYCIPIDSENDLKHLYNLFEVFLNNPYDLKQYLKEHSTKLAKLKKAYKDEQIAKMIDANIKIKNQTSM